MVFTLCVLMTLLLEDKALSVKITCHSVETFCLEDALVSKYFSARVLSCFPAHLSFSNFDVLVFVFKSSALWFLTLSCICVR